MLRLIDHTGNRNLLSDSAIEKEIGGYFKKVRQQQRKTQQQVADAAGISRSTLSLLERGESGSLKTVIQVLRVLKQLQVLQDLFEYDYAPLLRLGKQMKGHQYWSRPNPNNHQY